MSELQTPIPRLVDSDGNSDLFTMAHLVVSTPHNLQDIDAIAVLPGLGEDSRLIAAVNDWQANPHLRHLFVTGTNGAERTQTQPDIAYLCAEPFNLTRTEGVVTQVSAEHTLEQAHWLIDQISQYSIKSLALYVSNWHITRAYSTIIKTMMTAGIQIPIYPVAVPTSPDSIIPETGATAAEMSAGEAVRIPKYQSVGHVATRAELETYLAWLWRQTNGDPADT